MSRQAAYVGKIVATKKKIFALETKEDIYSKSNSSLRREFQYIVRMTRNMRQFYVRWAELKDFIVTMTVMTEISGYKAQVDIIYLSKLLPINPHNNISSTILSSLDLPMVLRDFRLTVPGQGF